MAIERLRANEARERGLNPRAERYINRETGETYSRRRGLELIDQPLPGGLSMADIEQTPQGRSLVRDFLASHDGVTRETILNQADFRRGYREINNLNGLYRTEAEAKALMRALERIGRTPQREWFNYLAE